MVWHHRGRGTRVVGVADRVAVPRRRSRTLLAIHRGVRRRMRQRLRHGTKPQGTTDRNDRRVATIRQGQVGGATAQAKPVVLRVLRVRCLFTEATESEAISSIQFTRFLLRAVHRPAREASNRAELGRGSPRVSRVLIDFTRPVGYLRDYYDETAHGGQSFNWLREPLTSVFTASRSGFFSCTFE